MKFERTEIVDVSDKKLREGYWPCACVKRDKDGRMTHIKLQSAKRKHCPKCKSVRPRPSMEWIKP